MHIILYAGRTLELIDKGLFDVSRVKLLVLDEADHLLSRDFRQEIK